MQTPLTYTFDDGKWPVDRLAIKYIETTESFSGDIVFPFAVDSVTATLHKCNPPDDYIKESRYIKQLPELIQLHPTSVQTYVSEDTLSYRFDATEIPVNEGENYALEFVVYDDTATAHYVGKIIITVREA